MKKQFLTFVLLFATYLILPAQCLYRFGSGSQVYTEVCDTTGATSYLIIVDSLNVNTIRITGLWEETQTFTDATVNCANNSYTFGPTQLVNGLYYMIGSGSCNSQTCQISYSVYRSIDSLLADGCTGIYASPIGTGLNAPAPLDLRAYPVPAGDALSVSVESSDFTLVVRDGNGRMMHHAKGLDGHAELVLSNFAAGLYMIEVRDNHSGQSGTLRFLKQ